ncbi:MAG: hypothetical protein ABIL46_03960 [candidate division WOR-3 bacterium]
MTKKIIFVMMILLLILLGVSLFVFLPKEERVNYITLSEVIPEANILSETEGIIEYNGKKFILGLNDLNRKRELIKLLRLDTLKEYKIIDMRFKKQIIVRKDVF